MSPSALGPWASAAASSVTCTITAMPMLSFSEGVPSASVGNQYENAGPGVSGAVKPIVKPILEKLYNKTLDTYRANSAERDKFLKDLPKEQQTAQVAALAIVGNVILNLDEVVVKE